MASSSLPTSGCSKAKARGEQREASFLGLRNWMHLRIQQQTELKKPEASLLELGKVSLTSQSLTLFGESKCCSIPYL